VSGYLNQTFVYTNSGQINSAQPPVTEIVYDARTGLAQQISVAETPSVTLSLQYASQFKRALKTVQTGSAATKTLYIPGLDGRPLMQKINSGSEEAVIYIHSVNGMIGMYRDDTRYYIIKDHQNSSRVVFDQDGVVAATFDYMPFGSLFRTSGDPSLLTYRFTGQEFDAFSSVMNDGLYNYGARLYDPISSRFYSPDPRWQYPSPYVYAGNNPVQQIDPTGEMSIALLAPLALLGAAAAGVLVGAFISPVAAAALVGAVIGAKLAVGTYAVATGMDPGEALDYANSAGYTIIAGGLGLEFGPAFAMSQTSIASAEFFGVINGFSIMPPNTPSSQYGYYIAAGIAISFASEALANTVVAVTTGGFATVPGAIAQSTDLGAAHSAIMASSTAFLTGTAAPLLAGEDAKSSVVHGAWNTYYYGVGAFFSYFFFQGPGALVQNWYAQQVLQQLTKQMFVMTSQEIFESRYAMLQKYGPMIYGSMS
jgi:RHS repeat-associated protein